MNEQALGFDVSLKLQGAFITATDPKPAIVLHNVTQIAYREAYSNSPLNHNIMDFDSELHGTGATYNLDDVASMLVYPSTELHPEF